jgi:hypothetical protein
MYKRLGCLLIILGYAIAARAQGAPDQINTAVTALGQQLGIAVTLNDLDNWQWSQELFPDSSLNCPQSGVTYNQVQIAGYIFTLEYRGTTYDYRVSADNQIVILCQTTGAGAPIPTPTEPPFSNPLCPLPEPDKLPYMRTHLTLEMNGIVTPGGLNRLRETPGLTGTQIGEIPAGAAFRVAAGPECVDEIVWWQVDYDGQIGWTAEGQGGGYFIAPFPPQTLPERVLLDATNAANTAFLTQLEGNFLPQLAWSRDGQQLALPGAIGSQSIWVYKPDALLDEPAFYDQDNTLNSLDFHPNGEQILFGTAEGGAHLWNLSSDAVFPEALFLNTHEKDALVAMHPDGTRFVAAGVNAQTTVNVDRTNALVLWDIATVSQVAVIPGHTAQVIGLAFNTDGTQLASVDSAGSVMLTTVANPTAPLLLTNLSAKSVTFSPNGQFLAVGKSSGAIDLLNPATGAVIVTYNGHLSAVNALSFSPDSALLASVSDDGTLRLWSTQTDTNLAVIEVSAKSVQDVIFSPLGTLIAAASDDHIVRLYGVKK